MRDFQTKIGEATAEYLDGSTGPLEGPRNVADAPAPYEMDDDARLEGIVFGRFLSPEEREQFYSTYKEIESLWEILSPAPSYATT